jgi:S-formylglutathione hydrolase FrmB
LFVAASRQDGTTAADAQALAAAAGPGVTTTVHVRDTGGHSWVAWAAMAAPGLDWLGTHEPS